MSDSRQSAMVKLFLASYDDFKARLKRRLGSEDLACDVLHETYLRVDRLDDALEVKKPQAYLFRIALNIAADRREGDARLLTGEEVAELLQVADEGLGPGAHRRRSRRDPSPAGGALRTAGAASADSHRLAPGRDAACGNLPSLRHFHPHRGEGTQGRPVVLRGAPGKKSHPEVRSRGRKTVISISRWKTAAISLP
ncbi:sigma-70 factor, ECF subfamily protein [Pseudomonas aeruginosa]|nr:sigma-70 factor, ECF subfamily protein [Pseudomonas aeruginosa]